MLNLYTGNGCPKCEMAIEILKKAGVQFNILGPEDAIAKGLNIVPVLELDDGTMMSFKEIIKKFREE